MESSAILEFRDIKKTFAGVIALDGVSLAIRSGEIHAIVGENGAGKSTLMKIVSGLYPHGSYSGEIAIAGEPRCFRTIRDSEEAGIDIIYQELALVPKLSVVENIFLGHEIVGRGGSIDMIEELRIAKELLDELGLDVDPQAKIYELGVGQQQLVEIAKAVRRNARILIFDEPTAALNETESKNLLKIIGDINARGVTCIYISHKLEEVLSIADRLTVLRDGQTVATADVKGNPEMREDWIISRMVGRTIENRFPWVPKKVGEPVLEVSGWTVRHPLLTYKNALEDVSLTVRRGEIVGLGGLMGAGRTEFAISLLGMYGKRVAGTLRIDGAECSPRNPREAIARGLGYLTEDRKGRGLVLNMPTAQNVTLASLRYVSPGGVINDIKEKRQIAASVERLRIKVPSFSHPVRDLSGGNQQKVVIAKWLLTRPSVLILDEPTRGIDVGAKYEIYEIMNELVTKNNIGILMISSELPELIGVCDRIVVMHEGRLNGEARHEDATPERIMRYATGGE